MIRRWMPRELYACALAVDQSLSDPVGFVRRTVHKSSSSDLNRTLTRWHMHFFQPRLLGEDSTLQGTMIRSSLLRANQNQVSVPQPLFSRPPAAGRSSRTVWQPPEDDSTTRQDQPTSSLWDSAHGSHLQHPSTEQMMLPRAAKPYAARQVWNSSSTGMRGQTPPTTGGPRQMRHSYSTGTTGRPDSTATAARQMRHSYSTAMIGRPGPVDVRPGSSAAFNAGGMQGRQRWTDPGYQGAKPPALPRLSSPYSDQGISGPLPRKRPLPGRLSRDRSGAKPNHVVTGSQHLNKLVGQDVFDSITVTNKDMAQFLHIFIDMEVSPDGTVSRANFKAHIALTAPNLMEYAMSMYDKALDSSVTRQTSRGGVKSECLDFRRLLHCIFPTAGKQDIEELVKMATRARLAAHATLARATGRPLPRVLKHANPRGLFSLWNTSNTGRLTLDECFEGMDAMTLNGDPALTFNEMRYVLEELYRVDDGKERGGQLNYMRTAMEETQYVRSVSLPEFTAWMKTRTKNTASLYT